MKTAVKSVYVTSKYFKVVSFFSYSISSFLPLFLPSLIVLSFPLISPLFSLHFSFLLYFLPSLSFLTFLLFFSPFLFSSLLSFILSPFHPFLIEHIYVPGTVINAFMLTSVCPYNIQKITQVLAMDHWLGCDQSLRNAA